MKINLLTEIGRVMFALPMIIFGVFHFANTRSFQNVVPPFVPGDTFWVYLTGAALIAAGISILVKRQVQLVANLLAVMLIVFVLLVHLPLAVAGDQMASMSLLKDTALAGGALILGRVFN